jgi:putative nucleotidyltransferase with HDIG domain
MAAQKPLTSVNMTDAPSLEEKPLRSQIDDEITSGRAAPQVMPEIGARVREITQKDNYSLGDLTEAIERGPALAARVLRYANSAAYAGLTDITDLHQAVTRLGARMVESIAVAAATRELYKANSEEEKQQMEAIWKHSVAAGETGRAIARELGSDRPEEVFLTCLLHDVGRVVILRALSAIEQRRGAPVAEGLRREVLDSLHAECGANLLETWAVPARIRDAVLHHHHPERAQMDGGLSHIVHLSDRICHKLGLGVDVDPELSLLALPSTTLLKFDDLRLASLMVKVEDAVSNTSYLA